MDAETGKQIWKTYMIPESSETDWQEPRRRAERWGPAGGAVWNSPTIDAKRHALYIGTGDAYTSPAPKTTDAVMALDLNTGKVLWSVQDTPDDAWLVGCGTGASSTGATSFSENCPDRMGPDYDFGSSPILKNSAGRTQNPGGRTKERNGLGSRS